MSEARVVLFLAGVEERVEEGGRTWDDGGVMRFAEVVK